MTRKEQGLKTVEIEEETAKNLQIYCILTGKKVKHYITFLINENLKDFNKKVDELKKTSF
jgi:hypothetical protein